MTDDDPCLCETNAHGFITRYQVECPWAGHPQSAKRDLRKQCILNTTVDLVGSLLYYDRKEDEELPVGVIEAALASGELRESDIVNAFAKELSDRLAEAALEKVTPLTTQDRDG